MVEKQKQKATTYSFVQCLAEKKGEETHIPIQKFDQLSKVSINTTITCINLKD
jgi:hypothetical protein